MTETHRGTVRRVFFANPEAPFMAGIMELEDGTELRFSGKCVAQIGDKLELAGGWKKHPRFGMQFEAETGLVKMDESPDALVHLLATDKRFEGLGMVRARKVVDAALALSDDGDFASALQKYPMEIAERARCPIEAVQNAGKVWNDKRSYFDALALLCEQGWSNAQAQKIIDRLGENAPSVVRGDPYLLIGKISRFGFRTVDAIAMKMGVRSTDPMRLASGVAYCLDKLADNGNTWTTREGLIEAAVQELRPDTLDGENLIREALESLIQQGIVHVDFSPQGTELVADARVAAVEFEVFRCLTVGLTDDSLDPISFDGPGAFEVLQTLNQGQREVLAAFGRYRYGVISGGAGVGKTYTMKAICDVARDNFMKVALCAPTGKAARKLSHATGRPASTIHRLLVPRFDDETGEFRFTKNSRDLLEHDLVIVDEVSMVDVRLMRSLLRAMHPKARLLLVGDHHQIPSVSPGAILRDLLAGRPRFGNAINILTEIVRQAGELARNTTAILDGILVNSSSPVWGVQRTEKGHEDGAAAIVAMLVEAIVTAPEPLLPFERHLTLDWDVQVIAPMKKGPLGTYALNMHLQKLRHRLLGNPPPEPVKEGDRPKPLAGDRVIWTKNDYELGMFNGTQAIVLAFEKGGAMVLLTEDGTEITVPGEKRAFAEVAYAMTIHKAQGSEWPCVILVGGSPHWIMHDRNLLYTGASRAAESLTIVGDLPGLRHFARERKSAARQTFGAFLVHGWEPRMKIAANAFAVEAQELVVEVDRDTTE